MTQAIKVLALFAVAGLVACMALCMVVLLVISVPSPVGLPLVVALAVIPAAIYSLLVVSLDRFDHEPWYTMLGAFLWGAIVSTFFSVILNTVTGVVVLVAWDEYAYGVVVPIVVAPIVEETTKSLALLILLLAARHEIDSVLDGIIYGALVGLGFAMTENALYFATFYREGGLTFLLIGFFLRAGIGGFSHAIFTAAAGGTIGWARRRYGRGLARFVVPGLGLLTAMSLHGIWNGVAVLGSFLGGFGALLGILGLALFLTLPAIIVILAIAVRQWDRQLMILQQELLEEVRIGTLTVDAYGMLTTPRLRRRAAWRQLGNGDLAAWWRLRTFMRLASRLAFQKHHAFHGEAQPSGFRKRSDAQLRKELRCAGKDMARA